MGKLDMVVVAGAGRGIGRLVALDFGARGVPVLCISKTANAHQTRDQIISQGGHAQSLSLDLADYAKAEQVIAHWIATQPCRRLGIVLAAGVLGPTGPLAATSLPDWDLCHRTNVLGNLAIVRALLPRMTEHRFGRIVAFAGGGSAYAYPIFPAYSATKTAMVRIVENLHEDLNDQGDFVVVCLAPGAVETDMLAQVRAAGAPVKTTVDPSEPVAFVRDLLECRSCGFSGGFVHVRDDRKPYLNTDNKLTGAKWKLRRID